MTTTLIVSGQPRTAVEAYSSGRGLPIHTYVLRGGDRLERIGDTWTMARKGSASWDHRPIVTVEREIKTLAAQWAEESDARHAEGVPDDADPHGIERS